MHVYLHMSVCARGTEDREKHGEKAQPAQLFWDLETSNTSKHWKRCTTICWNMNKKEKSQWGVMFKIESLSSP